MGTVDVYISAIKRADLDLNRALEGLSDDDLRKQPAGRGSNPIGWLVWHLARTRDTIVASIEGGTTIWEREVWFDRFKLSVTPPRLTPEQVHFFDPIDTETLFGYLDAVANQTIDVVSQLAEADMNRLVESTIPGRPAQPVTDRLGVILNDNIQHIGQIAYLRGLISGQGWY